MCGIAGFLQKGGRADENREIVLRMIHRLRHRGPDGEGVWSSDDGTATLGHARLSIQDLSDLGAQPMFSASGRFIISFNGEVYNFPALMQELARHGHRFRGHSDTEVMLAAIEQWGLKSAISKFIGMFAFALWDNAKQSLHLVRDRLGIKPMYYQQDSDLLLFGSELKALREHPAVQTTIDRESLAAFLRYCYVPAPYTIYQGIKKQPPGTILSTRANASGQLEYELESYWTLAGLAGPGATRFDGDYEDAIDQLQDVLGDAVLQRMISDVPLGAFLSGGIDSSIVAALMQQVSTNPVKTFTIGFSEDEYNEANWAHKVASHLRTDHTEFHVSPEDARAVIPDLASIYDEPFADSSQIPTILVSRLARRNVTVCLSGDGGDELFSGYKRYDLGASVWRTIGWAPATLRRGLSSVLEALARNESSNLDRTLSPVFQRFGGAGNASDKLQKAAALVRAETREHFYQHIASHWKNTASIVKGIDTEPSTLLGDPPEWLKRLPMHVYMMLADASSYLPDDILVKLDRASMSCGLEARVPILDHRVVEFAFSLPLDFKRQNGQTKSLMRDLLARFVPMNLIDRPKMGFGVPIDSWLRGALHDWAADLLSEERLHRDGYLDPAPIMSKWYEHQSGDRDWSGYLWDVLMFQSWLDAER